MERDSKAFARTNPSTSLKHIESSLGRGISNSSPLGYRIRQHTLKANSEYLVTANDKLEQWIDGNVVHSSTVLDVDAGVAEAYFHACLTVLRATWTIILEGSESFPPYQREILREILSRLVLWIEPFKAGELDQILLSSEDLKENVIDLLTDIANPVVHSIVPLVNPQLHEVEDVSQGPSSRNVFNDHVQELSHLIKKARSTILADAYDVDEFEQEASDEEALSDNLDDTLRSVSSASKRLMGLLPSLQRAIKFKREAPVAPSSLIRVPIRATDPAYVFVTQVLDKFDTIETALAQRLGQANWERHQRILRQLSSKTSLVEAEQEGDAESLFHPVSTFHDSGLGSSDPTKSSYATSNASHTSFVSDMGGNEEAVLRVPETPPQVGLGQPFECKLCGHTVFNVKNRIDWKLHVFADLKPYICTWPECRETLSVFPTRKIWGNHEFSQHRIELIWKCRFCSTEEVSQAHFKTHLSDVHGRNFSAAQLQAVENDPPIKRPLLLKDMQCPLCSGNAGSSQRAFETHVGRHMEQIALFSIPREEFYGADVESNETQEEQTSRPNSPKPNDKRILANPFSTYVGRRQSLKPEKRPEVNSEVRLKGLVHKTLKGGYTSSAPSAKAGTVVAYEGYTLDRLDGWEVASRRPIRTSEEYLGRQVAAKKNQGAVVSQMRNMSAARRAQIDRLIEDRNFDEKEPQRYEWIPIAVQEGKFRTVKKGGKDMKEVLNMDVYIGRRVLLLVREHDTEPNKIDRPRTSGTIIDLRQRIEPKKPLKPEHPLVASVENSPEDSGVQRLERSANIGSKMSRLTGELPRDERHPRTQQEDFMNLEERSLRAPPSIRPRRRTSESDNESTSAIFGDDDNEISEKHRRGPRYHQENPQITSEMSTYTLRPHTRNVEARRKGISDQSKRLVVREVDRDEEHIREEELKQSANHAS